MVSTKPVTISRYAFAFCRYSMAAVLWTALLLHSQALIYLAFTILTLSYILKIRSAPMIVLFNVTAGRFIKSPEEMLDENAMRFAHAFGSILLLIVIVLLQFHATSCAGWITLIFVAIGKTAGALGFCAARKLYTCAVVNRGACCSFLKRS